MRKGQMLTLEQMILFFVGVVIVSSVYFIFSRISLGVSQGSEEDQLKEAGSTIAGAVAVGLESKDNSIRVSIPPKINGNPYSIEINSGNITLTLGPRRVDIPLEGPGSGNAIGGIISSSAGRAIITRRNNEIKLLR
ncbi:MAG: hypothetical protein HZB68_01965 [Candidatus Aenigmarchaeota archaeon]|nr:hypothetical protein [Candidatus Aenigmarchaeota archaeon]